MTTPVPRVMVPGSVSRHEVFPIKAIIQHEMETGLRTDSTGQVIPRKIINGFVCRYGSVEVFRADLHEAVAANPFLEFYLRATESGRLEFIWQEDGGAIYSLSHEIVVT
ncbi:sulfur oxidation protein [Sinorhizobium fredii USDA 205]|nr:thiosulfate oxidation carrier complex protein SoxZ [Sinorhizobium fredii]KSV86181.1 sulfur oxidation protein [Sinorhizobium fredii USDA 205]GEC33696.1 thiosulfate oxidation carrier complex protein SoxZ [Sinorhizobium fredii]GLS06771.1 thiosulfate oxidation carrier complex protein SoxZ [Sinorhizobium fredii]